MRAILIAVVLICLVAATATAEEPAVKAAGETITGTADFLIELVKMITPTHAGPAIVCTSEANEGCEVVGIQVAEWRGRGGYLDGLATFEQEIRGVGLSFEPFAGNNLAIGACVWRDQLGGYAAWHIEF
ncbi:MAG TPA: hypothetical protein VM487_15905 [Phycisphaerae bacterium]|nr:hypothetical protein [Phycisphaerae bacterium]